MMSYLRYLFLVALGFILIVVALANRDIVMIRLLPEEIAAYLGQPFSYQLPQFVVIFGGIIAGLFIGFFWEWFREYKHRAEARNQRREKEKLVREVRGLKMQADEGKDEILALLDDAGTAR